LSKILTNVENASLTRLTVLKKWFAQPERLSAFAIWIAKSA
jgi:hypothetical protein